MVAGDRTADSSRGLGGVVCTEGAPREEGAAVASARVLKKRCDEGASHVRLACTARVC